jgi:DnaJ family protein C protein 17
MAGISSSSTPIKPAFKGLQADDTPKFSFSPRISTPRKTDFAATMERLRAAEKQRMEEQIRQNEAE